MVQHFVIVASQALRSPHRIISCPVIKGWVEGAVENTKMRTSTMVLNHPRREPWFHHQQIRFKESDRGQRCQTVGLGAICLLPCGFRSFYDNGQKKIWKKCLEKSGVKVIAQITPLNLTRYWANVLKHSAHKRFDKNFIYFVTSINEKVRRLMDILYHMWRMKTVSGIRNVMEYWL